MAALRAALELVRFYVEGLAIGLRTRQGRLVIFFTAWSFAGLVFSILRGLVEPAIFYAFLLVFALLSRESLLWHTEELLELIRKRDQTALEMIREIERQGQADQERRAEEDRQLLAQWEEEDRQREEEGRQFWADREADARERAEFQAMIDDLEAQLEAQLREIEARQTGRWPRGQIPERVREAHERMKEGVPLRNACKVAGTHPDTYKRYCKIVTGEDPLY